MTSDQIGIDTREERWAGMPSVGLALGGGGVRGMAHLGVLAVFEREGIPITTIAGSSMGAIIGAAYSLRPDLDREHLAQQVLNLGLSLPSGLSTPPGETSSLLDRFRRFIHVEKFLVDSLWGWGILPQELATESLTELTQGKLLEEGRVPLAAVAVDLLSGEKVIFREGPATIALQASSAIPGFFPPVPYEGRLLADGAILDLVPADIARNSGVDLVIAVDVDQEGRWVEVNNGLQAFLRAIELCSRHHKRHHLEFADLVIRPDFGEPIQTFEVSKADLCIDAGVRAAEAALPSIRSMLDGRNRVAGTRFRRSAARHGGGG